LEGLDFFLTAICFSVLGYGLCYIAFSDNQFKNSKDNSTDSMIRGVQEHTVKQDF